MPTYVALVNFTEQGHQERPRHRPPGRGLPRAGREERRPGPPAVVDPAFDAER
jgi:hypothetical protein